MVCVNGRLVSSLATATVRRRLGHSELPVGCAIVVDGLASMFVLYWLFYFREAGPDLQRRGNNHITYFCQVGVGMGNVCREREGRGGSAIMSFKLPRS